MMRIRGRQTGRTSTHPRIRRLTTTGRADNEDSAICEGDGLAIKRASPGRRDNRPPTIECYSLQPVRANAFNPLIKKLNRATAASSKPMMRVSTLVGIELQPPRSARKWAGNWRVPPQNTGAKRHVLLTPAPATDCGLRWRWR